MKLACARLTLENPHERLFTGMMIACIMEELWRGKWRVCCIVYKSKGLFIEWLWLLLISSMLSLINNTHEHL